MNIIVATDYPLITRMDKWFINCITVIIINHINPHHQSASWPVKWGDLLLPPLWSSASLRPLSHLISGIYDIFVLSLSWFEKHDFSPPLYLSLLSLQCKHENFLFQKLCASAIYLPAEFQVHLTFSFLYSCNNRGTYQSKWFSCNLNI